MTNLKRIIVITQTETDPPVVPTPKHPTAATTLERPTRLILLHPQPLPPELPPMTMMLQYVVKNLLPDQQKASLQLSRGTWYPLGKMLPHPPRPQKARRRS